MSATLDAFRSDALAPALTIPLDSVAIQSPSRPNSEPLEPESAVAAGVSSFLDVDPQILEALKSKDRLYVLKLGEQMESLILDHRHVSTTLSFPTFDASALLLRDSAALTFVLAMPFGE